MELNFWNKERKAALLKSIDDIKRKDHLQQIFKIIKESNHPYTANKNGIFVFFHNLSDDTYNKLNNYVEKLSTKSLDSTSCDTE